MRVVDDVLPERRRNGAEAERSRRFGVVFFYISIVMFPILKLPFPLGFFAR